MSSSAARMHANMLNICIFYEAFFSGRLLKLIIPYWNMVIFL